MPGLWMEADTRPFAKAGISVGRCLCFQTPDMFAAEHCAQLESANARRQRHVLIYQLAVQAAGGREAFPAVHTVSLACPFKTECSGSWQDNLRHSRRHASICRSNAPALDGEADTYPFAKTGISVRRCLRFQTPEMFAAEASKAFSAGRAHFYQCVF